jgi:hypothetical protein
MYDLEEIEGFLESEDIELGFNAEEMARGNLATEPTRAAEKYNSNAKRDEVADLM